MDLIKEINVNGTAYGVGVLDNSTGKATLPEGSNAYLELNTKPNISLVSPDSVQNSKGEWKGGKINIEAASDIQFKPGDDIIFYSHHRGLHETDPSKTAELLREVMIKTTDGDDVPVKMLLNTTNLTITTKDKPLDIKDGEEVANTDEEFNVRINTGKKSGNSKGYLKVRARAIDLRCEEHGGIALQPYGSDSDGNENKVKFEHGGGDGKEFFTMNTDKTSMFTNEYRFNAAGKIYAVTRNKVVSEKADGDSTTAYLYEKQSDDFYDILNVNESTTWENLILAGKGIKKNINVNYNTTDTYSIDLMNPYNSIQLASFISDSSSFSIDHDPISLSTKFISYYVNTDGQLEGFTPDNDVITINEDYTLQKWSTEETISPYSVTKVAEFTINDLLCVIKKLQDRIESLENLITG